MRMDESAIAKSGELHVEEKRFLKASWVKRFCVLYNKTADNHAYMELYDDKDAFQQHKKKNKKCEKRIELQNVKGIKSSSENSGKGIEHHIEIRTRFHKHNLMFSKESDFNDWFAKLNATADIAERGLGESSTNSPSNSAADLEEDSDDGSDDEVITLNQMYASTDTAQRYEVEVEPSDIAKLCDIEGKMTLLVGNNDLAFEDPKTKRIKYSFQLAWMRRFGKYKSQSFNFEVGRKCPNGEGSVSCKTPSAKLIHKTVTQKSASRSKTVIPHPHVEDEASSREIRQSRPSVNHVEEKKVDVPIQVKEKQVSQPVVPIMARKHPGKANTPNLIPIVRQQSNDNESLKRPKSPPQPARRGSKSSKQRSSGKDSPTDDKVMNAEGNGHVKQSHKVVKSGDFTKELELKLQHGTEDDHEKHLEHTKKDSIKTKEDKKREKEEKKERERKEKEEKKERERKEKEQEKVRKLREKEEKKSGKKDKNRDSNKSQELPSNNQRIGMLKDRIYDEPEIAPTQSPNVDDPSCIYDEATSPVQQNTPIEYAQPNKKGAHADNTDDMYEDAESVKPGRKSVTSQKVEYAEPYSKKGGIPVTQDIAMYADVKSVGKDAWKKLGRKEEEEFFEEDYSNIKSAREIVKNQEPPPVPDKNYEDDDEDENMYNTVDLKKPKSPSTEKQENLYGMASAKDVGPLPKDIVQIPEVDYPSDSSGSIQEEEATYDDPQYEGYEPQANLKKTTSQKTKVVEAYEETMVPVKPVTPKKQSKKVVAHELLYEEIN